jgi:hypothetical protein
MNAPFCPSLFSVGRVTPPLVFQESESPLLHIMKLLCTIHKFTLHSSFLINISAKNALTQRANQPAMRQPTSNAPTNQQCANQPAMRQAS